MLQNKADNMTMEEYQNIFWMQKRILDAVIDAEDQPKTSLIIQKCIVGSKENVEAARMAVCVC